MTTEEATSTETKTAEPVPSTLHIPDVATTSIVHVKGGAIDRPAPSYSRDQIDLLKRTVAKDTTDDELRLFLYQSARLGLDPFLKQVHAVKRRTKDDDGNWRDAMSIQVGIDGFRLIADRTERYAPGKESRFEYDSSDNLISATAYVKKFTPVDGSWHEVSATAFYVEFVQKKRDGDPNRMWNQMPHVMLSKVAEAMALRKAFPAELSGVYVPEEMDQAENENRRNGTSRRDERPQQGRQQNDRQQTSTSTSKSNELKPGRRRDAVYVDNAEKIGESKPKDKKKWKLYKVTLSKDGRLFSLTTFSSDLYDVALAAMKNNDPVHHEFADDGVDPKTQKKRFTLTKLERAFYAREEDEAVDAEVVDEDAPHLGDGKDASVPGSGEPSGTTGTDEPEDNTPIPDEDGQDEGPY